MSLTYLNDDKADDLAEDLFTSLTSDLSVIPEIDLSDPDLSFEEDKNSVLYQNPPDLTIADVTVLQLEGSGVFDQMMAAASLHLQREFAKNRITGDQYATVYGASISVVMAQAVQFVLGKDQAKWGAIAAQMSARAAEIAVVAAQVGLAKLKFETATAQYTMEVARAQVGLTKMEIANANAQHLLLMSQVEEQRYKVSDLLPITKAEQEYTLNTLMVDQHKILVEQIDSERSKTKDTLTAGGSIFGVIGKQKELLDTQIDLTNEQLESERSKTLNTRRDGTTVVGQVGKQKDLVTEQIDSFIKDAQYKTAKMYFDGFITQYTLLDTTTVPTQMTSAQIEAVLLANRNNNNL